MLYFSKAFIILKFFIGFSIGTVHYLLAVLLLLSFGTSMLYFKSIRQRDFKSAVRKTTFEYVHIDTAIQSPVSYQEVCT